MPKKLINSKPMTKVNTTGVILVDVNNAKKGVPLTNRNTRPFVICFEYKLEDKFNFSKLEKRDIKAFQAFLDKVSNMTFSQVDAAFLRVADKQDLYGDMQMLHYAVSGSFRIHGVIDRETFKVIRLDPNHNVHS